MRVEARSTVGAWTWTYTGVRFYPMSAGPDDIVLRDIAHALAHTCRYNGMCKRFYSVAEHSVIVSQLVEERWAKWGLMHDAAEAYLGDVIRPVKQGLPQFKEAEARLLKQIAIRFGLLPFSVEPKEVKYVDSKLLNTELEYLFDTRPPLSEWGCPDLGVYESRRGGHVVYIWGDDGEEAKLSFMTPQEAEEAFLIRYAELWS